MTDPRELAAMIRHQTEPWPHVPGDSRVLSVYATHDAWNDIAAALERGADAIEELAEMEALMEDLSVDVVNFRAAAKANAVAASAVEGSTDGQT